MTVFFSSSLNGSANSLLTFNILYLLRQLESSEAVLKLDSWDSKEMRMIAEAEIYLLGRVSMKFGVLMEGATQRYFSLFAPALLSAVYS